MEFLSGHSGLFPKMTNHLLVPLSTLLWRQYIFGTKFTRLYEVEKVIFLCKIFNLIFIKNAKLERSLLQFKNK